jgi:hypothetical protein
MQRKTIDYVQKKRQSPTRSTDRDSYEPLAQHISQPRRNRRKILIISTCIAATIIICAGLGSLLYAHSKKSPLPKNIVQSANFPIYYPSPVPQGYSYDPDRTTASTGLLIYRLKNNANKAPLTLTLQPVPKGFNVSKVFDPKVTPATSVPVGNEYNLGIGQESKYVIITDDGTLIFITSSTKIPGSTLHSLVNNLQLVK